MTKNERQILRFEYWSLLVAQSANIDEFGKKNYNIDQRLVELQKVFWLIGNGVPDYDDLDLAIHNQVWRFNIDKDGARFYTYINQDNSVGNAKLHTPKDLQKFVKNNRIR